MTLRRSVLYIPGNNAKALAKAAGLPADVLILDLEDAVAPADKDAARAGVVQALREHDYADREIVVRINDIHTDTGREDMQAIAAQSRVSAVLLPKVESADSVQHARHLLVEQGGKHMGLWAMIETPRGVMQVDSIAAADKSLAVLVMGTNDLAKAMRVPQTPAREGFQYALSRCVLAARCHGLDVIDGVYIHLDDEAGLQAACEQGLRLGFDGKTLIHPKQLAITNQAFAPSAAAVESARRMVAAWDAAGGEQGVMVVDGRLVEALHVEEARRTLALAERIAVRGS